MRLIAGVLVTDLAIIAAVAYAPYAWEHAFVEALPLHAGVLLMLAVVVRAGWRFNGRFTLRGAMGALLLATLVPLGAATIRRAERRCEAAARAIEIQRLGMPGWAWHWTAPAGRQDLAADDARLIAAIERRLPGWGRATAVMAERQGRRYPSEILERTGDAGDGLPGAKSLLRREREITRAAEAERERVLAGWRARP